MFHKFWLDICKFIQIRIQLLNFDADPDPDGHPDPDFYLMGMRMRIQVTKIIRIVVDPDPQYWLSSCWSLLQSETKNLT